MKIRVRLLPITIFAAALLLSVRVGGLWDRLDIEMGSSSVAQQASAGKGAKSALEPKSGADRKAGKKSARKTAPKSDRKPARKTAGGKSRKNQAAKTNETEIRELDPDELTAAELKVLQELSNRRAQLDQRERNIDMRTGLLKAAEKRIEEKLVQLKALQASISRKIKERAEKTGPRMQSLVKIYEKMKAKDAARIFAKLDLDILLEVIKGMREAKSAPILAAMDPTKAKEVTVELARQSQGDGIPGR